MDTTFITPRSTDIPSRQLTHTSRLAVVVGHHRITCGDGAVLQCRIETYGLSGADAPITASVTTFPIEVPHV